MVYGVGKKKAPKRFHQMPLGEAKNQLNMMYEVNKYSLSIEERPNVYPHSPHFVMERKRKRGKETQYTYYAETMQEAEAKVAELKADKIEKLKKEVEYHESQALYAKSRLMAILKEQLPDAGKVIDQKG